MDVVVLDGDLVMFDTVFAPAIVSVRPFPMQGSGDGGERGNVRKVCVQGDEQRVQVAGCPYTSPPFMTPGVGTLSIQQLSPFGVARKTTSAKTRRPVLLKGQRFIARFTVQMPAWMPGPNGVQMLDPRPMYQGFGWFDCKPPFVHGE